MRKLLILAICLSLVSTLAAVSGCEKKKEQQPVGREEVSPAVPEETGQAPSALEEPQAEEEELGREPVEQESEN